MKDIQILGPNGQPFVNTTSNESNKEDNMQTTNTNTTSHRYEVRYHLISIYKGNLYRTWIENNQVQIKQIKDLRFTLYAVLSSSLDKGLQPHFISFDPKNGKLLRMIQEINKEDETSFFVEFVGKTNFRVWRWMEEGLKKHLKALTNLTPEPATEVAAVVVEEGDAFAQEQTPPKKRTRKTTTKK